MAATLKSSRVVHALNLLSSLEGMKSDEILPDFTINVQNRSFLVHRSVLAACSGYFRAMLSHDTKEARDGFVDMKGVSEEAVKACIDFMYTGEASFTSDNARYIIHAANLMQLDQLTGMASKYLQENMTPENCLFVANSSEDYWREDVKRAAEEYAAVNIETIIKMEGFSLLRVNDVISFLTSSTSNKDALWSAVMKWTKYDVGSRMQHLGGLLNAAGVMNFPLDFTLDVVCKDKLLLKSEAAKGLVLTRVASDLVDLVAVLNVKRCLNLMKIMMGFEHSQKVWVEPIAVTYLAEHLVEMSKNPAFLALGEEQILAVFRSNVMVNQPEKFKWACIVAWIEQSEKRKHIFAQLLRCVRFERLQGKFIKEAILPHSLLREFPECKDMILEAVLDGHCPETECGYFGEGDDSPRKKRRRVNEVEEGLCVATSSNDMVVISTIDAATGVCEKVGQFGSCNSAAACCFEGTVYILKNGTMFKYHPRFGTWEEKAPIHHHVSGVPSLVPFRGRIYMVDERMSVYDPKTNTWSYDLPISNLAQGFGVVASDDFIFAMGGRGPSANKARKYRQKSTQWTDLAPMNQRIEYASAVMWKDLIYVLPRRPENSQSRFSVYDPKVDSWSTLVSGLELHDSRQLCLMVMNEQLHAAVAWGSRPLSLMKKKEDTWQWERVVNSNLGLSPRLSQLFQVFPFHSAK